jgi:hypothetical protein
MARPPVAFSEPGREAAGGSPEPSAELVVEGFDLVAQLEEAEVEQPLRVARVSAERVARNRRPALWARHVGWLRQRPEHDYVVRRARPAGRSPAVVKLS